MNDEPKLKDFVEKILAIQAPAQNIFGAGLPGMMGSSGPVNQASMTGKDDVVGNLKLRTLELTRLHALKKDRAAIEKKVSEIEGCLLMVITVSILTDEEGSALIDELHALFQS